MEEKRINGGVKTHKPKKKKKKKKPAHTHKSVLILCAPTECTYFLIISLATKSYINTNTEWFIFDNHEFTDFAFKESLLIKEHNVYKTYIL